MKYSKVIIWGHPLYSHTHSYVHEAYYRAFKSMGYDVHWFHDEDYPKTLIIQIVFLLVRDLRIKKFQLMTQVVI
jgi:hypothetical protein